jgi:phage replication O-like protein O
MASPQKEDGFTPIANEILDKLVFQDLTGSQLRILIYVIRKSYGYQRKTVPLSQSDIAKNTGLRKDTVKRVLSDLSVNNFLSKISPHSGRRAIGWQFNKDWESWRRGVIPTPYSATVEGSSSPPLEGSSSPPLDSVEGSSRTPNVAESSNTGNDLQEAKESNIKKERKKPSCSPPKKGISVDKIFLFWNAREGLITHKNIKPHREAIQRTLKTYLEHDVMLAIERYSQVMVNKTGRYRKVYAWTLSEFLTRKSHYNIERLSSDQWEASFLPFESAKPKRGSQIDWSQV